MSVYYAPFDYVNPAAKLIVVGVTPGRTQMIAALLETQRQLERGASPDEACFAAKQTASFAGMRDNLVAMLDYFGIHNSLGINSCNLLFAENYQLLHSTSVLRYPVFLDTSNYNGTPKVRKNSFLKRYVEDYFAKEAKLLREATFVPLGAAASEVLEWLGADGVIEADRILSGFPHPSGANNERISYLLEKKPGSSLSAKTSAAKLDAARLSIRAKIAALGSL